MQGEALCARFKGGRDKSLWFYDPVLESLGSAASDVDAPQLSFQAMILPLVRLAS